ncbi:MAG: NAD-dependent epimerase/dehydratase family protein [Planctomycetes bacterium]|nr:NAD-dependent epimerase/dehydratase family protein [Planctomycetota bacterium]
MSKRALVTGGTGFVGAAIVRELLANGEQVKVFRRESSPLTNLEGLEVEHAIGDLRDRDSLRKALDGCDRLYHCAALYNLSGGYDEFLQANVIGTRNALGAALELGIERVVHTSSIAAIGAPRRPNAPVTEEQVWNFGPLNNPYISSKFISEHEALKFAGRGLPVVIINPGAPIGRGDVRPTPTGQMVLNLIRGLYPMWVKVPVGCVDVDDCARQHRLCMEKGKPGERYLSVSETLTVAEMGRLLRETAGAPWRPSLPNWTLKLAIYSTYFLPQWLNMIAAVARYPLHSFNYDNTKAREELGMEFRPLKESLKAAADWYGENGYCRKVANS